MIRTKDYRNVSVVALLFLSSPVLAAQQVAIGGYHIPGYYYSDPAQIAVGSDGALWFTEQAGSIGRITTAGAITEYTVPRGNGKPYGITAGPDGAIWFTEASYSTGNRIGRITTGGAVTEFSVPTQDSNAYEIAAGPDGALWFTEYSSNKIGRITITGDITEFVLPTNARPFGITPGPDGAMWFAESFRDMIARITMDGAVTEYSIPTASSEPGFITAGPDGALWFTESNGNKIGRITTGGEVTEYPIPTANCLPDLITTGPDGALWFTEYAADKLGRVTTGGAITEYQIPTDGSSPYGITTSPDGALWFVEAGVGEIGQAVFPTASLSVSPGSGSPGATLSFSGSGFGANEIVRIYKEGVGSAVLDRASADASGSFSVTTGEPQSAFGPRTYLCVGQSSGKLGAVNFSVSARLALSPSSGPVGSAVRVEGYGFGVGEVITVFWGSPRMALGTATTDSDGTFKGTAALWFRVPADAAPGANGVFGHGSLPEVVGHGSFIVQ
jgi:virginiamycin B lyase